MKIFPISRIALIAFTVFYSLNIKSQSSFDFNISYMEATIGAGITIIDIDKLVEKDENPGSIANDWDTMNYGISGQYYFATLGNLHLGAELMYQNMYWYEPRIPYGDYNIYRQYTVTAFRVTPIVRFNINDSMTLDAGPELNFFDGLNLGLLISANYYFPITDTIDIPVKLRIDVINEVVLSIPVSLNAGVRLQL